MKSYALPIVLLLLVSIIIAACSPEKPQDKTSSAKGTKAEVVAMFLSDFHAGENYGAVSREIPQIKKGEYDSVPGIPRMYYHKNISELMHQIDSIASINDGSIPYLIMLGDIFDIAVHEASDAFNLAHDFFNASIYRDRSFISYFDTVIYLPGNHDHHVWHMLQEKYYQQDRLLDGREALPFPHQSPGILDIINNGKLQDSENNLIASAKGGNFISYLLSDNSKPVQVLYPNLYIRYGDDQGICVTHGHFFEPNWNKDSSVMAHFPDVNSMPDYFKKLEKYNAPFTEFSDYSIAQVNEAFSDGLTDSQFEDKTKMPAKGYAEAGYYLGRTYPEFFPLELNQGPLTDIEKLSLHPGQVSPYLYHAYLFMKEKEMDFNQLVYGHTHVPCFDQQKQFGDFAGGTTEFPQDWKEKKLRIHNTGGWVNISDVDTIDYDNATAKAPNPMFLYRDGKVEKVFQ